MAVLLAVALSAQSSLVREPAGDRWMYWYGDLDGARGSASVYGAYGSYDYVAQGYDFDDRHAQVFLDFDTTSIAPPGHGAANYQVGPLSVRLVVNENNAFLYDPTPDSLASFTGGEPDSDLGRPLELFGVGYQGGSTASTFFENSPYITGTYQQTNGVNVIKGRRNAFALDFVGGLPRDISNNVEEGFAVQPWAVGEIPGYADYFGELVSQPLSPGAAVPYDSVVTFQVNLSRPEVRAYVQQALNVGRLRFMVSSLKEYSYSAGGGAPSGGGFPSFYTKENFNHQPTNGVYLAARLEADVTIQAPPVPRPLPEIARLPSSGFRISFPTETGYRYQARYRQTLSATNFTDLGPAVTGDGTRKSVDDAVPPGTPCRFYHLEVSAL
jgi:hypothetical protein